MDMELALYLSEYKKYPAIFSDEAPEDAVLPYIVFRIKQSAGDDPAVQNFAIFIDYFDDQKSRVNSRAAANRLVLLLDRKHLDHNRFGTIRIFFFDGSPVEEGDSRKIHYSLQFDARSGRKAFGEYQMTLETILTTTTE